MPRKSLAKPRRLWPRLLLAALVVVVFAALWLLDTGALLQLARIEMLAHPRPTLGGLAAIALLITITSWFNARRRQRNSRKKAVRPPRKTATPSPNKPKPPRPPRNDA